MGAARPDELLPPRPPHVASFSGHEARACTTAAATNSAGHGGPVVMPPRRPLTGPSSHRTAATTTTCADTDTPIDKPLTAPPRTCRQVHPPLIAAA